MNYIEQNFHKWTPVIQKYSNGRIAIEYIDPDDEMGECQCIATVNMPDIELKEDEVCIKTYSENEGLYECMVQAGHIAQSDMWIENGYVEIPICKLLLKH